MWYIAILLSLATALFGTSADAATAPRALDRVQYGEDALAFSSGFIRDSLPVEGIVSAVTGDNQTTGNRRLLGKGDRIYLSLKNPEAVRPGAVFTLYRHVHEVVHPVDRIWIGNLFKIVGLVEVLETNEQPVTVKVLRAFDSIFPGDRAMWFTPPVLPAPRSPGAAFDGVGMIVDVPPAHTLVAQGQVVYLDHGSEDGLRRGDLLEVFRESGRLPKRVVGELKVLSVEPHTAAAVITKSRYPYLRGDRFAIKKAAPPVVRAPSSGAGDEQPDGAQVASVSPPDELTDPLVEGDDESVKQALEGLLEQLLFESGEATIRPEGKETLERVSQILKQVTDRRIQILGHTDNVPIGPSLTKTYPTNWELSQARAREVVRYLVEETGVSAERLSAVGYADTQPVASNASETGRQKNRRVEIVVFTPKDAGTLVAPVEQPVVEEPAGTTAGEVDAPSGISEPTMSEPGVTEPADAPVPGQPEAVSQPESDRTAALP